jgi:hypothetical protein
VELPVVNISLQDSDGGAQEWRYRADASSADGGYQGSVTQLSGAVSERVHLALATFASDALNWDSSVM